MESALACLHSEARLATSVLINTTAVIVRRTVIHGQHAAVVGAAAGAENVSATKGMQGLTAVNVLTGCMGLSASYNARAACAARTAFVRPTGLARASQASLATGVTPARRACSEMIVRWHAAGMTHATGTELATLQAHAYAKRGSRDRTARYATRAEEWAWSVSKSADGT